MTVLGPVAAYIVRQYSGDALAVTQFVAALSTAEE